jgi:FMN phosphatase YigB (HAD superfamily)
MHNWMLGNISQEGVIDFLSNHTGLPAHLLTDELRYSAENMQFIDELSLNRIEKLRTMGALVILATDNTDTFGQYTVPSLQLKVHFDDILCSSSINHLKTDTGSKGSSRFFGQYMQKMGVSPEYSVLIDDCADSAIVEKSKMQFRHVTEKQSAIDHLDDIIVSYS